MESDCVECESKELCYSKSELENLTPIIKKAQEVHYDYARYQQNYYDMIKNNAKQN
jgi:hypothetical protein